MRPGARVRLVIVGLLFAVFFFLFISNSYNCSGETGASSLEAGRFAYEKIAPYYNLTEETLRLNFEHVEQSDPGLVRLIKKDYIHHPSALPYNIANNTLQDYSQGGQSKFLDTLLNQMVSFAYIYIHHWKIT